jgi:hypothetical protein
MGYLCDFHAATEQFIPSRPAYWVKSDPGFSHGSTKTRQAKIEHFRGAERDFCLTGSRSIEQDWPSVGFNR